MKVLLKLPVTPKCKGEVSPVASRIPAVGTLTPLAPVKADHRVIKILVILVRVKHAQLVRRNRAILGVVATLALGTVKK